MSAPPPRDDPGWVELRFIVAREFSGWRADRFVAHKIPRLSRTRVQRILKAHAFDEEGRSIKPNRFLREGERIVVYKRLPEEPAVPRSFGVLFEDDWIVAVDKPAGLPVHPTARFFRNTLTALLAERWGDPAPVLTHRLDSETSGVLLCARDRETERRLKSMFARREVSKVYLAVVRGVPIPREGRIEAPLGPDSTSAIRVKMAVVDDGMPALTEYRVLVEREGRALVELRPRTGRQHQIRAHLAHAGHPVIGDKIYGPDESIFLSYLEEGPTREIEERAGFRRQALHATRVELDHPARGERLEIDSPLPDDLRGLIDGDREAPAGPFPVDNGAG